MAKDKSDICVIPMHIGKVCKGSTRYEADDPANAAVSNVYLQKTVTNPEKIEVVIRAL
jgi:hypothetical protein